ncbi:MAG: hypothetical protein MUE33_10825 [Cytophagaceae bacterium]|jgi:hypothetical protein|nr:hypothetical protein [Cytophagaceae bacterium]
MAIQKNIKLIREHQECIDSNYQGVTLNTFLSSEALVNEGETIIEFINSDYFKIDCKRDFVKLKSPEKQFKYLKPSFNLDKLNISDFRKVSLKEFCDYFEDYANGEWGDFDQEDFLNNWKDLKERISKLDNSYNLYFISKEWFEKSEDKLNPENADTRLRTPEFYIYIYYFLCIAVSINENRLIEFEIFYE